MDHFSTTQGRFLTACPNRVRKTLSSIPEKCCAAAGGGMRPAKSILKLQTVGIYVSKCYHAQRIDKQYINSNEKDHHRTDSAMNQQQKEVAERWEIREPKDASNRNEVSVYTLATKRETIDLCKFRSVW
jgi:hypothetical protein